MDFVIISPIVIAIPILSTERNPNRLTDRQSNTRTDRRCKWTNKWKTVLRITTETLFPLEVKKFIGYHG